jgi:hypothetical protein
MCIEPPLPWDYSLGVHSGGEHVAMIAVSRYDLIARLERHLHADDDGFLTDVQVAETADRAHAVELTSLLLEPANQQHVAQCGQLLFAGKFRRGVAPFVLP